LLAGWALKFIAEHNVKLASIGPNEIVDGDVKYARAHTHHRHLRLRVGES
jgi:hypothetical protein